MKTTNEIEKQLEHKAALFLEQKAEEIFAIYQEISKFVGTSDNFTYYITHLLQYDGAKPDDKAKHTALADANGMKKKLRLELALNYKKMLVAKYTKELISKLEIFE